MILVLIEFAIAQTFSLIASTRRALLSFWVDRITKFGFKVILVREIFPSIFSIVPIALLSNRMNLIFELSATNKKVDIKQELIAATNKCSGVHFSFVTFENSVGSAPSVSP